MLLGALRLCGLVGPDAVPPNNSEKLAGLRYEFQVYEKDARGRLKLRHDGNADGRLSDTERLASAVNDPWSNLITAGSGVTFRGSVITDPTRFEWKNDEAPREKDQFDGWKSALSIISNHDEVGNAERTMNTAEGATPTEFPDQWSRGAARFAAGIGMAGPGIPVFFQGDEFGAQNDFRWGNPSTWDSDWNWESLGKDWNWEKVTFNDARKKDYERLFTLPPGTRAKDAAYQGLSGEDRKVFERLAALPAHQRMDAMLDITKKQSFQFYRDAIALRQSSPAFRAEAEVNRVYTHNDDSVMAFTRKAGGEEYLVWGAWTARTSRATRCRCLRGTGRKC